MEEYVNLLEKIHQIQDSLRELSQLVDSARYHLDGLENETFLTDSEMETMWKEFSDFSKNIDAAKDFLFGVKERLVSRLNELDIPYPEKGKLVTCGCGRNVWCDEFTNTCDVCLTDYNWAGQRLAPRSQWGEETGEVFF